MVGGGNRKDDSLVINSTNVFAALGSLWKKKKSDKEQGSSKAGKSTSKDKQEKDKAEPQVFWSPAPLTAKSWADVDDEDDDDYYATNAPIQPVWGAAGDQTDKEKESSTPFEVV